MKKILVLTLALTGLLGLGGTATQAVADVDFGSLKGPCKIFTGTVGIDESNHLFMLKDTQGNQFLVLDSRTSPQIESGYVWIKGLVYKAGDEIDLIAAKDAPIGGAFPNVIDLNCGSKK